jgi:hypothetical protein
MAGLARRHPSLEDRRDDWIAEDRTHHLTLQTVLSFSHGRPTIATMEHFFPARDHTEELKEMDHYEETQLEGIVAVPGAAQVAHALQNHTWGIVTSAWRTLAEARIAAGLPLPKVIVPVDGLLDSALSTRGTYAKSGGSFLSIRISC